MLYHHTHCGDKRMARRYTFEKRTFHYSGTTLWNFLPVTLEELKSLEHFKRNSKIYFLRNQENEIT
jgi:hypothetical protein